MCVEFTLKYNILLNVNKLIYKLAVKNGLEILHGTSVNTSFSQRIWRGYKEDKMSSSWVVHPLNCFFGAIPRRRVANPSKKSINQSVCATIIQSQCILWLVKFLITIKITNCFTLFKNKYRIVRQGENFFFSQTNNSGKWHFYPMFAT